MLLMIVSGHTGTEATHVSVTRSTCPLLAVNDITIYLKMQTTPVAVTARPHGNCM
jgi:hypothetical protein